MSSVAAVLFVRNEADDIAWWVSHYAAVGFTSLIIFDDHSTDGTWEILNNAKSACDVKLHRTDRSEPNFYWRQRNTYLKAIELYGDAYEWLGFFDGDEYFYPVSEPTVGAFLDRFPEAHGVAVSWCTYGSGGHAFKPQNSPIEAYTTHSRPDLPDNELIKSFIRPKHFGGNYIDPHRWNVDDQRYVAASGELVQWRGSGMEPQWDHAKVLHFVCRSMQHYLERIARRSDLYDSTAFWNHFDRNDVQDLRPLRLLHDSKHTASVIGQVGLIDLYWQVKRACEQLDAKALEKLGLRRVSRRALDEAAGAPPVPLRYAEVETLTGEVLYVDRAAQTVRARARHALDPANTIRLFVAVEDIEGVGEGQPERMRAIMFAETSYSKRPGDGVPLWGSPVLLDSVPFVLEEREGGYAFRSPVSHHYMSANPESGVVEANRGAAADWETFRLVDVAPTEQMVARMVPHVTLASTGAAGRTLKVLVEGIDRLKAPSPGALGCALAFLPKAEQKQIMAAYPGRVPGWLRNWVF